MFFFKNISTLYIIVNYSLLFCIFFVIIFNQFLFLKLLKYKKLAWEVGVIIKINNG